jgi:hypothetical protein
MYAMHYAQMMQFYSPNYHTPIPPYNGFSNQMTQNNQQQYPPNFGSQFPNFPQTTNNFQGNQNNKSNQNNSQSNNQNNTQSNNQSYNQGNNQGNWQYNK